MYRRANTNTFTSPRILTDHNKLPATVGFPHMPELRRLWLNYNNIDNAAVFIEAVAAKFPKLRCAHVFCRQNCHVAVIWCRYACDIVQSSSHRELSLLGNPGNPHFLSSGTKDQYDDFRCGVM